MQCANWADIHRQHTPYWAPYWASSKFLFAFSLFNVSPPVTYFLSLSDGNKACVWCGVGQAGPGQSESGGPRRRHQKLNFLRDLQEGLPWPLYRVLHRWAEHGTHDSSVFPVDSNTRRRDMINPIYERLIIWDHSSPHNLLRVGLICCYSFCSMVMLRNPSHLAWPVTCIFALHCWLLFINVFPLVPFLYCGHTLYLTVVVFIFCWHFILSIFVAFLDEKGQLNEMLCNVQWQ